MSKAADLARTASASETALSNRNLIINGAMQVAQRSASTSSYAADGYSVCDRWMYRVSSLGTWTISQDSNTPNGFGNSTKWDCTTADASPAVGDTIMFSQRLEGQDLQQLKKGLSDAENVTLSFYVNSVKTGTYIVELYDVDNTRHISKSYTISSADTWEYKTITFEGDTSGAFGDDNARSLDINFWLGSGTNFTSGTLATSWASVTSANRAVGQVNLGDNTSNDWRITGVQLEVGPVATPFEHRSFGQELALCQRYFQKTYDYATAPAASTENGWAWYGADYDVGITSTFQSQGIRFESTMRAAPTMVGYDASGNSGKCVRYRVGHGPAANIASSIDLITTKNFRHFGQGTNATGNIAFHYTADAEL